MHVAVNGAEPVSATFWQLATGTELSEKSTLPPGVTAESTVAVKVAD